MSSARRHDHIEGGKYDTDEDNKFKKVSQTVNKPPVADNINDQYYRDPPNNLSPDISVQQRATEGEDENAFEKLNPKEKGVLGDEAIGKQTKEATLGEMVNESSVHGGLTGA